MVMVVMITYHVLKHKRILALQPAG
jgi:hypothetical protein